MIVGDKSTQAEELCGFSNNLGRISAKTGKKLTTNVLKKPSRALELSSNLATAAATKSLKVALSSLPEVISFYHTSKGLYLGNFG